MAAATTTTTTTTMIHQHPTTTTTNCSSRVRTVSVENIPKAELEASAAAAAASAAAAAGGGGGGGFAKSSSHKNRISSSSKKTTTTTTTTNTATTNKPLLHTTTTKASNNNKNINNTMKLGGKKKKTTLFHLIHKPHPESKVGIDLIEKKIPGCKSSGSGGNSYGVYIKSICPGCLAAKQTNLIAGLRVYQVNGITVETLEEANNLLLIKRTTTSCGGNYSSQQVSILTQSYKEVDAIKPNKPKKKKLLRGFRLFGGVGVGLTLAAKAEAGGGGDGIVVVSKVNPKGLFPTLQPGQYVLSINGRSIRNNVELANKILLKNSSSSLRLVVVEPDEEEEVQEEATKAQQQPQMINYMDKYADDFVEGDDYENFIIQSFEENDDSDGGNTGNTDGIASSSSSGEGGGTGGTGGGCEEEKGSSTVSTALMSSTVRSYSVTNEYELMDKIDIQMKDYDYYYDNNNNNYDHQVLDAVDGGGCGCGGNRKEVLDDDETDDTVSSVISEMTDNENETSNSNSNSNNSSSRRSRSRSRTTTVVISVTKSSIDDICGMKAKKNVDDGRMYITHVNTENGSSLFAKYATTLTGASIDYINGVPCPTTTPEFVDELKRAYPRLVLECTLPPLPPLPPSSPSNNKDSSDDNDNNSNIDQDQQQQRQQQRHSSSTTIINNRRDMLLKEPSNFSCLDQHLEEILPENFDSSSSNKGGGTSATTTTPLQFVENSKVLAEATKLEITQKAGLRLRRSNPTNSVFISAISDDSIFLNSKLQVGMKILNINGKPCPTTTTETVQRIKDISGSLQIEAAMIDWDATLSDAWTAAAAAAKAAAMAGTTTKK